jgi:hypothetical protein
MIDNCYCFQLHDYDMISFYFSLFGNIWILCSIESLVSEHLHIQGRPDSREGFVVSSVQTKLESLLLLTHLMHSLQIIKNESEMRKLQPPKVERVKISKKTPPKH